MMQQLVDMAILITLTVFIHGAGAALLSRVVQSYKPFWERHPGMVITTLSLSWVVCSLVFLHMAEIGTWALFYLIRGVFPDFETCAYYSLTTYTTVGYGDVVPHSAWRLFGTTEALVGILMCAWSTALLIGIVTEGLNKTAERIDRRVKKTTERINRRLGQGG